MSGKSLRLHFKGEKVREQWNGAAIHAHICSCKHTSVLLDSPPRRRARAAAPAARSERRKKKQARMSKTMAVQTLVRSIASSFFHLWLVTWLTSFSHTVTLVSLGRSRESIRSGRALLSVPVHLSRRPLLSVRQRDSTARRSSVRRASRSHRSDFRRGRSRRRDRATSSAPRLGRDSRSGFRQVELP